MPHIPGIMYAACLMGVVPLLVAARAPIAYRWLAVAFGISFLADLATLLTVALHTAEPWWVSRVYPVSQAALACAVFLPRREAMGILAVLVLIGLAGVFLEPPGHPEFVTHIVAWLFVAAVAAEEAPRLLRRSLVAYFGLGALAWTFYVSLGLEHSWWLVYQGTRVLGIGLFGYACWKPTPQLRLT